MKYKQIQELDALIAMQDETASGFDEMASDFSALEKEASALKPAASRKGLKKQNVEMTALHADVQNIFSGIKRLKRIK